LREPVSQPHFHDEELRKYETKTCLLKRRRLILNPSVMVRSEFESQTSVRDGEKAGSDISCKERRGEGGVGNWREGGEESDEEERRKEEDRERGA
jgi:hypothetical protein